MRLLLPFLMGANRDPFYRLVLDGRQVLVLAQKQSAEVELARCLEMVSLCLRGFNVGYWVLEWGGTAVPVFNPRYWRGAARFGQLS